VRGQRRCARDEALSCSVRAWGDGVRAGATLRRTSYEPDARSFSALPVSATPVRNPQRREAAARRKSRGVVRFDFAIALALVISGPLAAAPLERGTPELSPTEQAWISAGHWGAGANVSPAFAPDGRTVYFAHADNETRTIMVSRLDNGAWSAPQVAPFSGHWRDIEPSMAPDGSYLVFVSNRPSDADGKVLDGWWGGEVHAGKGGNLWRVERSANGWGNPVHLPAIVNSNPSIYAPAVAANGNLYFNQPDPNTGKTRLYRARRVAGNYTTPEPLPFSDGIVSDYDAAIAPDESFIVFSSNRSPTPKGASGIFVALAAGAGWKTPVAFAPVLLGIESRLSPNLKTLYFSSGQPTEQPPTADQNLSGQPDPAPLRLWQQSVRHWH
jgi:hypothetical protein